MRQPAAYIMASGRNCTLYVGVTSNLVQRASQHRAPNADGFAPRNGCKVLVFYELYEDMAAAILREKQLKSGSRARKLALIETANPQWRDLYGDIL